MSWGTGLAVLIAPWIADIPAIGRPEADTSGTEGPGADGTITEERQP